MVNSTAVGCRSRGDGAGAGGLVGPFLGQLPGGLPGDEGLDESVVEVGFNCAVEGAESGQEPMHPAPRWASQAALVVGLSGEPRPWCSECEWAFRRTRWLDVSERLAEAWPHSRQDSLDALLCDAWSAALHGARGRLEDAGDHYRLALHAAAALFGDEHPYKRGLVLRLAEELAALEACLGRQVFMRDWLSSLMTGAHCFDTEEGLERALVRAAYAAVGAPC